jgi:hypothetical protein
VWGLVPQHQGRAHAPERKTARIMPQAWLRFWCGPHVQPWGKPCQVPDPMIRWPHETKHTAEIFMEYNFDQVHNYYERLVFEEVARWSQGPQYHGFTADMLADVACLALNRLPVRYVRHDVDMMFYLTEQERQVIEDSMQKVLAFAFAFVQERSAKPSRLAG